MPNVSPMYQKPWEAKVEDAKMRILRTLLRENSEKTHPEFCGVYKRSYDYCYMSPFMGIMLRNKPTGMDFVPEWNRDERIIDKVDELEKNVFLKSRETVDLPAKYKVEEFLQSLPETERNTAIYVLKTSFRDTLIYVNAASLLLFLETFETFATCTCYVEHRDKDEINDQDIRFLWFQGVGVGAFNGFLFSADPKTGEQHTILQCLPIADKTEQESKPQCEEIENDAKPQEVKTDKDVSEDDVSDYQTYKVNDGKDFSSWKDFKNFDADKEMEKLFKDAPDVDWRHTPMKQLLDEHKITKEEYDTACDIQAAMVVSKIHAPTRKGLVGDVILYLMFYTPFGFLLLLLLIGEAIMAFS